jgi:hypothetical protein
LARGVAADCAHAYLDGVFGEESIMVNRAALLVVLSLSGLAASSAAFAQAPKKGAPAAQAAPKE